MLLCVALHWQGCEREVLEAEKQSSQEYMQDCLLRLSWALVHSKHPQDVHRGIAMLECLLLFHHAIQLCMCVNWWLNDMHVFTWKWQHLCLLQRTHCSKGRSFIFWLLDTIEMLIIQGVGISSTGASRYVSIYLRNLNRDISSHL